MTDIVQTSAGILKIGSHYDILLEQGSLETGDYSDELFENAKIIAFEHAGIGIPGQGKNPGEMVPGDFETRYQVETQDRVVGFLPENVVSAREV